MIEAKDKLFVAATSNATPSPPQTPSQTPLDATVELGEALHTSRIVQAQRCSLFGTMLIESNESWSLSKRRFCHIFGVTLNTVPYPGRWVCIGLEAHDMVIFGILSKFSFWGCITHCASAKVRSGSWGVAKSIIATCTIVFRNRSDRSLNRAGVGVAVGDFNVNLGDRSRGGMEDGSPKSI